jgi:hypothetical protein
VLADVHGVFEIKSQNPSCDVRFLRLSNETVILSRGLRGFNSTIFSVVVVKALKLYWLAQQCYHQLDGILNIIKIYHLGGRMSVAAGNADRASQHARAG